MGEWDGSPLHFFPMEKLENAFKDNSGMLKTETAFKSMMWDFHCCSVLAYFLLSFRPNLCLISSPFSQCIVTYMPTDWVKSSLLPELARRKKIRRRCVRNCNRALEENCKSFIENWSLSSQIAKMKVCVIYQHMRHKPAVFS